MRKLIGAILLLFATTTLLATEPEELSLRALAESGNASAMNYLGFRLISGEAGEEKNVEEGLYWLTRAAEEGDVKAASNLGWLYIQGEVLDKDLKKGVEWLAKASEAGLPVAQSLLGDLYRAGEGVAPDSVKADSLYREAFEHGLADAGYKLYDLNSSRYAALPADSLVSEGKYFYFRGAPSEGVKLFYMAADQGNATALALLGDAYTRALGVPYDYLLSLKYYTLAALAGNPSAQFVVGELLDIFPDAFRSLDPVDFPVPPNDDPSYWYDKAAKAGITDAVVASERLFEP